MTCAQPTAVVQARQLVAPRPRPWRVAVAGEVAARPAPTAVCRACHLLAAVAAEHADARAAVGARAAGGAAAAATAVRVDRDVVAGLVVGPPRVAHTEAAVAVAVLIALRVAGSSGAVDAAPVGVAGAGEVVASTMAGAVVRAHGVLAGGAAVAVAADAGAVHAVAMREPAARVAVHRRAHGMAAVVPAERTCARAGVVGGAGAVRGAVVRAALLGA